MQWDSVNKRVRVYLHWVKDLDSFYFLTILYLSVCPDSSTIPILPHYPCPSLGHGHPQSHKSSVYHSSPHPIVDAHILYTSTPTCPYNVCQTTLPSTHGVAPTTVFTFSGSPHSQHPGLYKISLGLSLSKTSQELSCGTNDAKLFISDSTVGYT